MRVAELLAKDSENLYKSWNESYNGGKAFKDTFREHNNSSYPSALSCIDEILAYCETIANEVGEQKIGSPYQQYKNGNHEGALYAVESWYSWHSRDDYSNNIVSIRNSYFGSLDNKVADNSIAGLTAELNPELDSKVKASIEKTYNAILSIPSLSATISSALSRRQRWPHAMSLRISSPMSSGSSSVVSTQATMQSSMPL